MTTNIRRICLFGGPGSGKSTCAAYVYARLKEMKYNVEQVQEYVKSWAYQNIAVSSFDQVYLLAKQIRMEDLVLRNGVEIVVTDSPVGMATCYAQNYGFEKWKLLVELAQAFEEKYPSLNIFLDRRDNPYEAHGRYQTLEEAIEMDNVILNYLKENNQEYHLVSCKERDELMNIVTKALKK